MKKRVSTTDDHAIVRSGIKSVIKDVFPFAVIQETCRGNEVVLSVRKNDCDLVIKVLIFSSGGKQKKHFRDLAQKETGNPFDKLSGKEKLIAHYYLKGYTSTEIKKLLRLHASTIGTLKTRMFGKLKIKSMVDFVELARLHQPHLPGEIFL